ncbi:hypothetical protein [Pseudomonas sp. MWU12-2345]|uniref:hypothetical protein n=1 Tax=Pseudomonas sp. MWU12-2345 TaxID=2928689 RepID=UPI00201091E5|nr:hypothetical protein [Pseudomonas sp. MWU12-2345]
MKKETQVTASTQMFFSIDNIDFQHLTLSPVLYSMAGSNEPFEYLEAHDISSSGFRFYTNVRTNDYGQRYGHTTASHELKFKSSSAEYNFNAFKFGNQVIYSTASPDAAVIASYWIFEDIQSSVGLEVRKAETNAGHKKNQTDTWCQVQINDQVIQYSSADTLHPAPKKKVPQVIISDTDKFSFLSNVNIYFSGCDVYRALPSGQVIMVDRHGNGSPALASEYYLTPDKSYPSGLTTLTINDGFSDATAVIEFDHDVSKKQVTMTIKSFTSRLCDIRDVSFIIEAPNAICFAL